MIGQTISHYRITEKLGQGGMGVVYKAEDTKLHRTVVLKFIAPQEAVDQVSAKRFIHEAQAAASLSHPNIATIYEYDEIEDAATRQRRSFIAMEYVEGETLGGRIARKPLAVDEAASFLRQIALGLETAHQHGIIHRDVKPANIIIAKDGNAKILDFGLARLMDRSSVSASNTILGTAAYMSPEQVKGETVDQRTDIWSLGVLLFEMLTQKLPFRGEHPAALMYTIVHEMAVPLGELRPDAPSHLQELCRRCLEKDPSRRPQTMEEVLRSLNGGTIPPGQGKPKRRIALTRRQLLGSVSGIAAAGLLLWLIMTTFFGPPGPDRTKTRLAILPFMNLAGRGEAADWPLTIQSLFVQELTGVEELGVIDPTSLNGLMESSFGTSSPSQSADLSGVIRTARLNLLIEGTITKTNESYTLQSRLVDATSGEVVTSQTGILRTEAELPGVIRDLSQQFLAHFQVEILHNRVQQDLRPWIGRRMQNLGALKAFMQASENIFRGEPGAQYLRRAVELDSLFISPRVWLVAIFVQSREAEEAERHYEFLKTLEAEASPFEQAMIRWAGAYIAHDTIMQVHYLQRALDYAPQNNILLYNLALVRSTLKDYRGAVQAIEPAIEMRWNFSPAYYLAAKSLYRMGDWEGTERTLMQSLPVKPADPGIYVLLSILSYQKGDTSKAREYEGLFRQSYREFGAKNDVIDASLGDAYAEEGYLDQAETSFRQAITLDPVNPEYHTRLAQLLRAKGNKKEALDVYLRAVELDSTRFVDQFRIGELYEELGDSGKAMRHYTIYLSHDTVSAQARELQKRILHLTH